MKIYLVGGAVRDALLGEQVREKDWVVVGATSKEMLEHGFKKVGKQFPVFIHPETNEEYALARTEHKTDYGYHGFEFDTSPRISIEEDLKRRDLTINAIAQDENGTLIDPWGGQADIESRIIRHISDAFTEDPVRILRVARFAARFHKLGFKIVPKTLVLMKEMIALGEVDYLVAERVWKETAKAFATNHPSVYLKTLWQIGALACIAPELDTLLCRSAVITDKNGNSIDAYLFRAIDEAAKHPSEVLLAILSFYAYRNGFSIGTLSERWKLPRHCSWMINAVERFDDRLNAITDLSNEALLDFVEQTDAIRNRRRFENFLIAYEISSQGGADAKSNIDYVQQVLDTLVAIEFGPSVQGLSGKHAKGRVREIQLQALNSL